MLKSYFKALYERTMTQAYARAMDEICAAIEAGGSALDCGAGRGQMYDRISARIPFGADRYTGIEWDEAGVSAARSRGLNVIQADLNRNITLDGDRFQCVFALSLVEHLLNGCRFMKECHRVLQPGGRLVLLTPNISTYFTAALILAGRMPSSGPHPDSEALLRREELFKVSSADIQPDVERDTPRHRHLVVFSYRVLRDYLRMIGFRDVRGYGYGLYPFPNFLQPLLERADPWHCHQMVFVAEK